MLTEVKNRVHGIVDELFPGFLNENNSGIVPFTQSSLYLMQDRFSPKQIRRRKRQKLVEILKRLGTSKAEHTAAKLQQYAGKVLHAPVEYVDTMQLSLAQHVKHIRCLKESVVQMDNEIALNLAQVTSVSMHGTLMEWMLSTLALAVQALLTCLCSSHRQV